MEQETALKPASRLSFLARSSLFYFHFFCFYLGFIMIIRQDNHYSAAAFHLLQGQLSFISFIYVDFYIIYIFLRVFVCGQQFCLSFHNLNSFPGEGRGPECFERVEPPLNWLAAALADPAANAGSESVTALPSFINFYNCHRAVTVCVLSEIVVDSRQTVL